MANFENRLNHLEQSKYEADELLLHITVPVNFGGSILLSSEQLQTLDVNSVYQIDLVYTKYKQSPDFDQEALNSSRVQKLKRQISEIDKDAPMWNFIAQTEAIDSGTAHEFFHGFVIYYRPKAMDYTTQKEKFKSYRQELEKTFTVDNTTGGQFNYPSGTVINVPANAVTYANGKTVEGDFEIQYTEYRNSADVALSGIPMKFEKSGENLNFSSVGMYEIKGFQGDTELQLQKPISVDFNCTKIVDNASFYKLDENTNEWKLIRPIETEEFGMEPAIQEQVIAIAADDIKENLNWHSYNTEGMDFTVRSGDQFPEEIEIELNRKAWKNFNKLQGRMSIDTMVQRTDTDKRLIFAKEDNMIALRASIFAGKFKEEDNFGVNGIFKGQSKVWEDDGNRSSGTLLAEGMGKGHTYPTIVKGLNTPEFGVYNCDQIYRTGATKTIRPIYVDAKTGKQIRNADVACLMDLTYNGSFSFNPSYVTYNPKGKNALLLTTSNNKTYLISSDQFTKTNFGEEKPTLEMTDVTEQLKSSSDLKTMLGI